MSGPFSSLGPAGRRFAPPRPRSLAPSGENQEQDIVCAEGIVAMFMGIDIVLRLKARAKEILIVFVAACTQNIFWY